MRKRLFFRRVRRAHHLFAGHRPPRYHPSCPSHIGNRSGRSPDQVIDIPFFIAGMARSYHPCRARRSGPCPRWGTGTVVGGYRLRRTPERPGLRSHAGAWERAKPWCARRTLPAIMRKRLFVRRVRRAHHLFAGHRPPRCPPSRPRLMGSRRGRSLDQGIDIPFLSRAWPAPTTPAVLVG